MEDPVNYYYTRPGLYLYMPYLQDLIYNYLLNCLSYVPLSPCPLAEWADSWLAPLFLSIESRRCGTHGTKAHQQLPSPWQASFNPVQPDLPVLVKLPSALFDLEQLIKCSLALVE
jgi:hypothetical protein